MNENKVKQVMKEIKQLAKEQGHLSINEIRIVIALERVVARFQSDPILSEHLIFKGGFVLFKHFTSQRFTRDVDALALQISKKDLKRLVQTTLAKNLNDGLWYGDIKVAELDEQGTYGCYRFDMGFQIGQPEGNKLHKLSRIHIDIGFSDTLTVKPKQKNMISILPSPEPVSWKVYPIEQIVAEKVQTLLNRGSANSRAKDVYDLVHLLPRCENLKVLKASVSNTFKNRHTEIPASFVVEAKTIDLIQLQQAWPSVKLMEDKRQFDVVWESFLQELEVLDSK